MDGLWHAIWKPNCKHDAETEQSRLSTAEAVIRPMHKGTIRQLQGFEPSRL